MNQLLTVQRLVDGVTIAVHKVPAQLFPGGSAPVVSSEVQASVTRLMAHAAATNGVIGSESFRAFRELAGFPAVQFAALLQVRPETISSWERGHTRVPPAAWAWAAMVALDGLGLPQDARALLERTRFAAPSRIEIDFAQLMAVRVDLAVTYHLVDAQVRAAATALHPHDLNAQTEYCSRQVLPRSPTPWHHLTWEGTPVAEHSFHRYRMFDLPGGYAIMSVGDCDTPAAHIAPQAGSAVSR